MELPRIVHDEFLHKVDEPQEQHLEQVLHAAEVQVPVQQFKGDPKKVGELSPLLKPTPSGNHIVVIDPERVEAILDAEERDAIEADNKMNAWSIVSEESVILVKLAIPMIMAAMLEILPELALTMMIGHVNPNESTQILAAFNLSGLCQMLLIAGLLNGLSSAIDTLCSQAFGAKKMTELWLFCQAGFLMYSICAPFMLTALVCGSKILKALGQDPAIADIAGQFLLINTLLIPFGVLFSVMKSALQAQNIVFPFVVSSLIGWIVSGVIAYLLAFHTPLGYLGIAVANPLCWLVKSLMLVPVILQNELFQATWPGWKPHEAMALVPKISKLGVSSVLMVTFQMLGFSFISLLAGLLPNAGVMITANGIFTSIIVLSFMPLLGICIGGAIRIGNALGAGKARRAALIGRIVLIGSVSVACVGMVATAFIAEPYARSFTPNVEATKVAIDLIHQLLPVIPLLGFTFGIQSIFRACGKQLVAAQFNFVCMFVLGVPLGLFYALKLDAGLAGLWWGNMSGLVVFMFAGLIWLWRLRWDQLAHEAKHNTNLRFGVKAPVADAF
uniref:Multidrug and toxin extrusion protein n=1 Tax=Globisporangium ultimum (strain ATCC 200006 / CBS 805.95 / DAOM BR144) TaxID=431595 RepID=K3WE52_GLOUD